MDENDIKAAVLNYLLLQGRIKRGCAIANEFALRKASVRADLAILEQRFIGIEIKSPADSLRRLETQINSYKEYFDQVMMFVATNHVKNINLNDYQGVEVYAVGQSSHITPISQQTDSKQASGEALLKLLTKNERERLCVDETPMQERRAFELAFSKRYCETSELFWNVVGKRRRIKVLDLHLLSKYRPQREAALFLKKQNEQRWTQWTSEIMGLTPTTV
ncbi:sce7726 family protein [Granulibacter bethesdensis]|uniref:Cytosolic protein n=1 Tax=Granulibacter bethesdensis (strain ATCC BAA-1260 / CGDNIH1) TaxID=391165 RepID=A0A286M336_GRABC|nr:sce7726 family protein [Granulibacter bethesdensis]AHJ68651.1 putative cytosolic protein [Granulibacter bethesdensis]APH52252.1 putative cytosolic protein [Granulibacter bethesdensis]APH64945.1 putative cytosolic protein [Granulibacter bethesdensis]ASV62435.1 putative cytosolic protein [Granulibacter bethesdensis CGDNIH1]